MRRWRLWVVVGIAVSVGSFAGPPVAQAFLGASGADLVYTPVTPCRIVDTRVAGAGGPLMPGVPRDFLVSGTVNFAAQGGTAGGCGIPKGATAAFLNLVAVNPAGPGDLRAWPFAQPEPFASIINYTAVSGLNIANGVAVPLCNPATAMCNFDVSVAADVNGTQLVVDVLGFLQSTAPRVSALGTANTFLGVNAGNFTMTGIDNTATGANALTSNTTGCCNTATGFDALFSNTTGNLNTATGDQALFSNTNGSDNTATGLQALFSNTEGSINTATGRNALGFNTTGGANTATGFDALFNNTTGSSNTATGRNALLNNTTGGSNTATGDGALMRNFTGSGNTAVGAGADVAFFASDLSNATAIGAGAVVDISNKIRLGNDNVAIVQTHGDLQVGAGTTMGCVANGSGTVIAGTCVSDARLKTDFRPFAPLLDRLVQLQPVHFRWHADAYPELQRGAASSVGLVAQEVEKVLPELVTEDARGYKAVRYHLLPLMLIQALKEQQEIIHQQKKDIERLEAAVMSLARRAATLQGPEASSLGR